MSSGRTLHQFQRSCWLSESTGGSADIRDSRTHQELADKEFSTATCGNVVGAPWPCSPTTGSPSRTAKITFEIDDDELRRVIGPFFQFPAGRDASLDNEPTQDARGR